jgi:hypothetical protein
MKALILASMVLASATPAMAATNFLIDFEKSWGYGDAVDNTYLAQGVTFSNVLGLSNNDGLGNLPGGAYYANAPTPLGVAYAQLDGVINTAAYINVAGGVDLGLRFSYSSPVAITNAVRAYSGLNGTGTLLGSLSLAATDPSFSVWNQAALTFSGTALSFDITPTSEAAAFDNISPVPEAQEYAMMLTGLGVVALMTRRRKAKSNDEVSISIASK